MYAGERVIDKLGRITVPAMIRKQLQMVEGRTILRCYFEDGKVIYEPMIERPTCMVTGETEDLVEIEKGIFLAKRLLNRAFESLDTNNVIG